MDDKQRSELESLKAILTVVCGISDHSLPDQMVPNRLETIHKKVHQAYNILNSIIEKEDEYLRYCSTCFISVDTRTAEMHEHGWLCIKCGTK